MNVAKIYGDGLRNDEIFNLSHWGNRDNCYEPYAVLRDMLSVKGYELHTGDIPLGVEPAFELHLNTQKIQHPSTYLLRLETPNIFPSNGDPSCLAGYRKIFTWDDDLVDGGRFIKINFPNPIHSTDFQPFSRRSLFCCLIAGNKSPAIWTNGDLYQERINSIRWFELNAAHDFHLYGVGWDVPQHKRGWVSALHRRIHKTLIGPMGVTAFPSYKGRIESKASVLQYAKFAICYENVKDLRGYVTEKIFDCFFSGCVPIYWGAQNICEYIPQECFIDRKDFADIQDVYHFLCTMTAASYQVYQDNIKHYLLSEKVYSFSSEYFAKTIVDTVLSDLSREA